MVQRVCLSPVAVLVDFLVFKGADGVPEGSRGMDSSDLSMGSPLCQIDSPCQFRRQDIFMMGSLLQQSLYLSKEDSSELFQEF